MPLTDRDIVPLDHARTHLAARAEVELLEDVERSLDDIDAGRVRDARTALEEIKARRARPPRR